MKEEDLLEVPSDKTGKLAATDKETYKEWGHEHTKKDKKLITKSWRKSRESLTGTAIAGGRS